MGFNGILMGYIPSGYVKIANWKMAIEIVDFPMKNGDFPWQNVSLPEGKWWILPTTTWILSMMIMIWPELMMKTRMGITRQSMIFGLWLPEWDPFPNRKPSVSRKWPAISDDLFFMLHLWCIYVDIYMYLPTVCFFFSGVHVNKCSIHGTSSGINMQARRIGQNTSVSTVMKLHLKIGEKKQQQKKLPWVPVTSSFRMNSSTGPSASLLSLGCFNSPFFNGGAPSLGRLLGTKQCV